MPVWEPSLTAAGFGRADVLSPINLILPAGLDAHFFWSAGPLGDIIPVPLPFVRNVLSLGDVILDLGLAFFLFAGLVRHPDESRAARPDDPRLRTRPAGDAGRGDGPRPAGRGPRGHRPRGEPGRRGRAGTSGDPGQLGRRPGVADPDVVGRRGGASAAGRTAGGRDPGAPSSVRPPRRQRVLLGPLDWAAHQPPGRPGQPGCSGRARLRDHELGDRRVADVRGGDAAEPPVRTAGRSPRGPLGAEARPGRERPPPRSDRAVHPGERRRQRGAGIPPRLPADVRLDLLPAGADRRDPAGGPRGRAGDGELRDVAQRDAGGRDRVPVCGALRGVPGERAVAGVLAGLGLVRRVGAAGRWRW